jgi:methylase of polypeptide subunit release factors
LLISQTLNELALSWGASGNEKGEVFTKPEIVRFMLQTSGITDSILNKETRILEPSCGEGEFVVAVAQELCQQLIANNVKVNANSFINLICAFDISTQSIAKAKKNTVRVLNKVFNAAEAKELVDSWFKLEDFLLYPHQQLYTYVIGNPPYVRIENIPIRLLKAYRLKFSTMKQRADLYIAFYEKSLSLLEHKGILSFICTDRWTKNRYGKSLREMISKSYQLDVYIDLYGQDAFQSEVLTYPAITQISRQKHRKTIIAHNPSINAEFALVIQRALKVDAIVSNLSIRKDVVTGGAPWLFGSQDELDLIKRLENEYPLIETVGCNIYIGAATGNNKVYIVGDIDIEPCRKVPLIRASDIKRQEPRESGLFIINTYDDDGVIDLSLYPLLEAYLIENKESLSSRHVAKSSPKYWYKTIDRVYPHRAKSEKLLIPDIKSELQVFYEDGQYHPNNSMYYICSKTWNLRALEAVLMSGIGQLFVQTYSTKIAGGNLRFQAQHLRRIRLPDWNDITIKLQNSLIVAGENKDIYKAKELVCKLYNFNEKEKQIIGN